MQFRKNADSFSSSRDEFIDRLIRHKTEIRDKADEWSRTEMFLPRKAKESSSSRESNWQKQSLLIINVRRRSNDRS